MDLSFFTYYRQELEHLKKSAAEFGRKYPQIAGRLRLDKDGRDLPKDPYVERLLEGFAFLAARIHLKMDTEFPTFTQSLLESVYPQVLAPIPSMAILAFNPNFKADGLDQGPLVESETEVTCTVLDDSEEETECVFQTGSTVRIWPLKILTEKKCWLLDGWPELPHYVEVEGERFPLNPTAAVLIPLQVAQPEIAFQDLPLDSLRIFLSGAAADPWPAALYEEIFVRKAALALHWKSASGEHTELLDASHIQRVGFDPSEALLPQDARQFDGHRLLREYGVFPQRFLFFDLIGLRSKLEHCDAATLDIFILLNPSAATDPDPSLARVDSNCLRLFCTPAINLFERECSASVSDRDSEFSVDPASDGQNLDIFDVSKVIGQTPGEKDKVFEPFYRTAEADLESAAFYSLRRKKRMLDDSEWGKEVPYEGSEVLISLVDQQAAPYSSKLERLILTTRCTNRHLAARIDGTTKFELSGSEPLSSVVCVAGPSPPVPSPIQGDLLWKSINHLSLNYLSILEEGNVGARALKEMLSLFAHDHRVKQQVEAIASVSAKPVVRRLSEDLACRTVRDLQAEPEIMEYPAADRERALASHGKDGEATFFARGIEVVVRLKESPLKQSSGAFLLGAILDNFFTRHVSINSFTETVIITEKGKEIRWNPNRGSRPSL